VIISVRVSQHEEDAAIRHYRSLMPRFIETVESPTEVPVCLPTIRMVHETH